MTLVTPGADDLGLDELFGSVQRQIKELRHDLESLKEEMKAGEEFETRTAKEALTRLKGLVSQCTGLEQTLAKCRNEELGIARGGVAFDFEVARSEIESALNRIRDTGGTEAVSG